MIYFFASGHVQEFFSDTNMCAGKLNGPPLIFNFNLFSWKKVLPGHITENK